MAKRLTEPKAGGRFGFGCPINWWFWVALVGQAGGSLVAENGRISLGDAAGVRALRLWQELVRDGLMKPPPGRDYNAWEQCNQDFLSGRAAMIWSSTAFLKYLEAHARFKLIAAPLPADVKHAVPTGGTFWVVLRGAPSAEKAAAVRFLRFMHEPEQVIAWSTRTGYIPVTRAAVRALEQRGYYAAHPNDRVALEQLSVAEPWPWSVDLFRIQREIVQPRLESAVIEQRDASGILAEARALSPGAHVKPSHVRDPYWMLLPTLLLLFVFFVFPLAMLVKHSLFSWDLLTPARYVGLGNYRSLWRSGELWQTFGTTLSMSSAVVLGSMTAGLALALLLDRPGPWAAFVRSAVFSAYVVSWVSVGLLFLWLLDADSGIFAGVWRIFWHGRAPRWLADPALAPWAVAAVTIWKITGYALVIFLSGLQDVPQSILEAAELDGASTGPTFRQRDLAALASDHACSWPPPA